MDGFVSSCISVIAQELSIRKSLIILLQIYKYFSDLIKVKEQWNMI